MVRLNSVSSRDIVAAGYDKEKSELHIKDKEGNITVFHRVPFTVYQDFLEAKFKGRFVKKQLIGLFVQTERVEVPA